jgi:hypothetical protein
MSYNPSIPQPGDIPSQSQSQFLTNFTQLNTQFGTEHFAFNAASSNGKHKYVTLIQNPTIAAPLGTELLLRQVSAASTNDVEFVDVSGNSWYIPLRRLFTPIAIPAGTNNVNLLDFSTAALGAQISGTIQTFDLSTPTRQNFTPFAYFGGVLYIPVGSGQLASGNTFAKLQSSGSVLQLVVNGLGAPTTITLIITESRT